jgi:drug/metabolite transporter (DMT)-like permease
MLGAVLGLFSASIFSINTILVRRGMLRASPDYFAMVSIFTGPPFFFLIALIAGALTGERHDSWQTLLFWALSGLIHFGLGRSWAYRSIRLIGANRSNIVTSLNPLVTVFLAVLVLEERLSALMVLGIFLSLCGPLLIVMKEEVRDGPLVTSDDSRKIDRRILYRGMLYGIGTALFWGSSAIFIKLAVRGGGSPFTGTLVAYLAASLFVSPSLVRRKKRKEIFETESKLFRMALLSGMCTNVAQLMRFIALAYGSVIVVSLMGRTVPLWVLIFSFLFNRELESFSRWVILGSTLLFSGTLLIIFS